MEISLFALAPALSGLAILLTGVYVFRRNPYSSLNRAHLCFSLALFGWLACYTVMYNAADPKLALRWARAGFFFIAFIAPTDFYVTLCLLRIAGKRDFMLFLGAVTFLLAALSPTRFVYTHVERYYWGFYPRAGACYPVFIGVYSLTWLYSLYLLYWKMHQAREARDFVTYNQSRYLFFSDLGGVLGVVDFLGKYGIPVYPFAYVIALFWVSIIAFAITRFRILTDISFLIRRALIGSAAFVALAALGGAGWLAAAVVSHFTSISNHAPLWAAGCLGLGLSFQPVYHAAAGSLDRLFFSEYHDRERKIAALNRDVMLARNAAEFNRVLLEGILSCFKVVRAAIFLWDDAQKAYVMQSALGWGLRLNESATTRLPEGAAIARHLEEREDAVLNFNEIIRDFAAPHDQRALAFSMLQLDASVCVPIRAGGRLKGIMALGEKESGLPYGKEDLAALRSVAGNVSVVLENMDLTKRWDSERRQSSRLGQVLHRYMSSSVADEILNRVHDAKAWRGDRRHVAVLMSDLRGFTELSENRPLEEVVESLNEYFAEMTEIILSAGGTVDKFMGDAILVVFGAPVAAEDVELKAARCAVEMRRSLLALNGKRAAAGLFPLEMGIGISAGEVVAGNIGSDKRMEYTVIGDAVNLASRLQGLANAGQILATAGVTDRIRGHFSSAPLGPVALKGKGRLVDVFEILGSHADSPRPLLPK